MSPWLTILAAGAVTYAIRLSFILLLERMRVPIWFQRSLRFVPMAVLSAIILPGLVDRNGTLDLALTNPQLLAGFLAGFVAWRTKNVLITISVGMAALLVLQALLGG